MNKPFVSEKKQARLRERMARLGLLERDLEETFVLGSGKGGQKINRVANCVWIRHRPSGIVLKGQPTRSLAVNRYMLRMRLCEKYEHRIRGQATERARAIARRRRQKQRRLRRHRERCLADKRYRATKKTLRRRVAFEPDRPCV